MTRDTKPIPFVSEADAASTQDRLGRLSEPPEAGRGRIDTSGGEAVAEGRVAPSTAIRRELIGVQAVALLIARLRAQTEDSLSRPVPLVEFHQESATAHTNGSRAADREPPVADFMEPVDYTWTEAGFEARQALKRYSEQTHADY
jgi:hypothetical protein